VKLLKKPTYTQDTVTLGAKPARTEVRFNPFGLVGIGPIATLVDKPASGGMVFPGRKVFQPVEIDFEADEAIPECLMVDAQFDVPRKRREPVTIHCEEDGWVYILHGLWPHAHLRDNVWVCIIDYFEC
jgi:hypothetical protein